MSSSENLGPSEQSRFVNWFAVRAENVDRVTIELSSALGLVFEEHDSAYWGNYCLHRSADVGEIRVYRNQDPMHDSQCDPLDDRFFEPKFRDFHVLIYVECSRDWIVAFRDALRRCFPDFAMIPEAMTG